MKIRHHQTKLSLEPKICIFLKSFRHFINTRERFLVDAKRLIKHNVRF